MRASTAVGLIRRGPSRACEGAELNIARDRRSGWWPLARIEKTAGQVAINLVYVTPEGRGRGRPAWSEVTEPPCEAVVDRLYSRLLRSPTMWLHGGRVLPCCQGECSALGASPYWLASSLYKPCGRIGSQARCTRPTADQKLFNTASAASQYERPARAELVQRGPQGRADTARR